MSKLNIINTEQFSINQKIRRRIRNEDKIQDKLEINSHNFCLLNNKINKENNIINRDSNNILDDKYINQNVIKSSRDGINKANLNKKNIDIIIKRNKDILLDKKKKIIYNENLIKSNNNEDLVIKDTFGRTINNIIEKYGKIVPSNSEQLSINGIKLKNEINNKIIIYENESFEFFNNIKKDEKNIKNEDNNNIYEIEKGDGLEINPYEIKRTKNNINNIFISYENKIQVLNNQESIYTEKAKKIFMKIIFPIKIKKILEKKIKKDIFYLLNKNE